MKPYTIADFNQGKKAVYRNGSTPSAVACDAKWRSPFVSVTPFGNPLTGDLNGKCSIRENDWDLMLDEPDEIIERWINDYGDSFGVHQSEEEAKSAGNNKRIALWKHTWNKTTGDLKMESVKFVNYNQFKKYEH